MAELPSGTVTFVFTDLAISTRLWEAESEAMRVAMARHDAIVRQAIDAHGGLVVKGRGDGFHAVFATADAAVGAAIACQLAMSTEPWTVSEPLRTRIGIHTGVAELRDGDYFGSAVNRSARLEAIAHGGQIVCSQVTADLARDAAPEGVDFVDLGEHRLRDLSRTERVFQVCAPGLTVAFPPLRSVEIRGNLPPMLSSFVGRHDEVLSVVDALEMSRVVTVIGAGGIGKTRVALQAAIELQPRVPDGVWFCALASVVDRDAVPEAVVAALGLRAQAGAAPTTTLVAALANQEMLLVFDNCEHVIDAAGALVEAIVQACPRVRVLATSREALVVEGEALRPLRSLSVPDAGATTAEAAALPALRLFADRARAVQPDFALDDVTTPVVADICRQLDGMPLAIELAAARTGALTLPDIARRLDQRFRLLTGGRRSALERHQTLRATVDWSYDLLDDTAALAFTRLAPFAGGFTLDAAEAVVQGDSVSRDDVFDLVSGLVHRSLVETDLTSTATRYSLHETMRQYARERLEVSGSAEAVRRRHAEHFVSLAEAVRDRMLGPDEDDWVRRLSIEFPNLRVAFDWAIARDDVDLVLRLCVALGNFSVPRPRYDVLSWLVRALAMTGARDHPLRPEAAAWAVHHTVISGRTGTVVELARLMDEAFEEAGSPLTVEAHGARGMLANRLRHQDDAVEHMQAAVNVAHTTRDGREAFYEGSLALMLVRAGRVNDAIAHAEHSYALASALGAPSQVAPATNVLGYVLSFVDPDRAVPYLEAAWALSDDIGNETLPHVGVPRLASIVASRGDLVHALDLYDEILGRTTGTHNAIFAMLDCENLAIDLVAAGELIVAVTILAALIDRLPEDPLQPRAALEQLRTTMGDSAFDACWAKGRSMDIDALVAYARAEIARIRDGIQMQDAGTEP